MNGYTTNLLDTENLIKKCRDKDQPAWAHFVGLYGGLIRWGVYRKLDMMNLRSSQDAVPDIVQEIFLTMWEKDKLSTLKNVASLKSWLVVMAKNAASNYYRKRINNKEVEMTRSFEEGFLSDSAENALYSGNSYSSLEEATELDEIKEILKQEIAKLNQKQRQALKLSIYNCKKQNDIAETMGISPDTVASLIRRAKTRICKEIKKRYAL